MKSVLWRMVAGEAMEMGYRIRYDVRRKSHRWLGIVLAAGMVLAAANAEKWYWEFARFVGGMIRGAH